MHGETIPSATSSTCNGNEADCKDQCVVVEAQEPSKVRTVLDTLHASTHKDNASKDTLTVLSAELACRNGAAVEVMLAKARKLKLDEVKAAEEMRLQRKRQKRNEHTKARCVRREQRDRTTGKDSRSTGNGVQEHVTSRQGVAVALRVAGGHGDWTPTPAVATAIGRSRTRRRYEKRVRKAKAKERRELRAVLATMQYPEEAFFAFGNVCQRYGTDLARSMSRARAEAIGFAHPSATDVLQGRARRRRWYEDGLKKVVPFQCSKHTGDRTARARLVRRPRERTGTRHNVNLAVSAPDGTEGLFLPDRRVEPHIFMAPTLAVVQRGKGITKLAHQWVGPAKVVQDAGFDNVEVVRDDTGGHLVTHSSFLVASSCPSDSLGAIAERILAELAKEDDEAENVSPENERRESVAPLREEDHSAEVGRGRRGVAVPAHAAGPEPGAVGRTEDAATLERVGEVDIGQDGEASDLPARVAGSAQQPAVTAANATPEPMNPIIVTSGSNVGENLPVGPVTQRQATGGSKQRKRKPRPGSDVNNGEKQELQKRQEVDTAREARLARRQAARNEQKAPAVEEMGPDDGRGLHGGGHAETPGSKGNDRTKAGHGASRQQ
ncbi:hypothetical protein PF004_g16723 [Phytophthora fragariae]|uniref:Uncharacterized protein n=2 Tax=Phytophthora fragariae TaxID=53985 RepID=A0A6G0NHI7_9STRA|nr:hypothetical protein PF004_g16723 [Phytophthora fragariae]